MHPLEVVLALVPACFFLVATLPQVVFATAAVWPLALGGRMSWGPALSGAVAWLAGAVCLWVLVEVVQHTVRGRPYTRRALFWGAGVIGSALGVSLAPLFGELLAAVVTLPLLVLAAHCEWLRRSRAAGKGC